MFKEWGGQKLVSSGLCLDKSFSAFQPLPKLRAGQQADQHREAARIATAQRASPGAALSAYSTGTSSSPPLPFVSFYSLVPYSLSTGLLPWLPPTN